MLLMNRFLAEAAAVPLLLIFLILKASRIDPVPADLQPVGKFYVPNNVLHQIEKIGVGFFDGAEDLAVDSQGRIYAGCSDGWIKRFTPSSGHIENWAYVGGHPLGLTFGMNQELLVVEPVMGLLNVTQGGVEILSNEADGVRYKIADELVVARDNTVYFTDASIKFGVADCRLDVIEARPNGRLLKYDPLTRTTSVLLRDLYFPNGVALSRDEDFLVFCETSKGRCRKLWLKGPRTGTTDSFVDNLPSFPDNIHINSDGDFWIALVSARLWHIELVSESPFLKRLVSPLLQFMSDESFQTGKVMAVSGDGEPLAFYEDPNGEQISFVTTAIQHGHNLYLGNLGKNYIGRLNLSQLNDLKLQQTANLKLT